MYYKQELPLQLFLFSVLVHNLVWMFFSFTCLDFNSTVKLMDELESLYYGKRNRCNTFLFTKNSQLVIEEWTDYYAILVNIKRYLKGIIPAAHRNSTWCRIFSSGVIHLFSVSQLAHSPAEIKTEGNINWALMAGRVHPTLSG